MTLVADPSGAVEVDTAVVDWPVTSPFWVVVVVVVVDAVVPLSAQAARDRAAARAKAAGTAFTIRRIRFSFA